ncbi:MAG: metal-dependent hydrolase [Alphaproteobacteria bacterium]|nr:metal-dependent hydrolase [Alphaproteobacteria bacterium]
MDGFTQIFLGAAIGTVTIGRKVGARNGAIIGGVIAELPDADFFFPSDTRLDGFVDHRGPTHSIVMQALATPVFGEALRFLDRRLRDERWLCYGLVFAAFSTHALLDGFTTYGTKLLWPIFTEPISWSSIFIIDPLYTLPLLLAFLVSLYARPPHLGGPLGRRTRRAASAALILSTAYLGWTMMARELAETKVLAALAADEMRFERLTLTPMPFNSLLWRGLAIDGERYANVYVSLLDGEAPAPVHRHQRDIALEAQLPDRISLDKIAWFSRGFYTVFEADGAVFARDLRMGVEPDYFFTFEIARRSSDVLTAVAPVQRPGRRDWSGLGWMWQRIFDETAVRDE